MVERFVPASSDELAARASRARQMLHACNLCERRCGVDRIEGQRAPCGVDDQTWCFKRHVSFAEEFDLIPSYMVYFGGCNFRCRFCVQAPTCFAGKLGSKVEPAAAAQDFARIVGRGAKTINLLGGEPSLHLHTILEIAAAAAARGESLPLVLNSNMYMTPEVIDLLDGVVPLYVADFKFGNNTCACDLAGIDRYVQVVTRNLLLAASRAQVIVRHLLMPGHLDCCLRPVADWVAAHLPKAKFTLMTGYVPAYRAVSPGDPLSRCLTEEERSAAELLVEELGLITEGAAA
jgi:putative pyruvate formate lyase activating enzyme